jgi:hypothetical protein
MKPARIGTAKADERGYQEYLQQSPYGVLEIGCKNNGVDEGACFTSYEIASDFMQSIGRKLQWGKLPYPLHRAHIEEIKRMKAKKSNGRYSGYIHLNQSNMRKKSLEELLAELPTEDEIKDSVTIEQAVKRVRDIRDGIG